MNTLADALKKGLLEDAKQRIDQGEKLPKDFPSHDRRYVYDQLARAKAYDIMLGLVKNRSIETDLYEYEKLDGSVFESLFRNIGNTPEDITFLETFLPKVDNINDAVNNKTLLALAFSLNVPLEVISALADAGCDIRYRNNAEENYLYGIVQEFNIKEDTGLAYLSWLISQGLDPNEGNIVRETPLHLAIGKNKTKYIELLLQQGADPNQPGKEDETAYYYALVHQVCGTAMYDRLAQYATPDFEVANKNKETIFCGTLRMRSRVTESDIAVIKALLRDGADIYQTSPYYQQPKAAIDWVAEYPADMLEAILEAGVVEIDRRDDAGNTLLHKVCGYNVNYDQEAARQLYRKVKLLIEHGADTNLTNDRDQSAMDLAAQDNLKAKAVELLLKHKV
ncbi:ankyrin repeat domain-containing protein [Chitinophaga dinghuensis]|uniref:ankyrin repeat domain-containing protein n=1 Tax=Chitinophaga dinghuensis TaxID=1539050 RepID=UPI00147651B7|nr:ankyrin repeat domain-containing protein [Chitinophaga dinghuensis]